MPDFRVAETAAEHPKLRAAGLSGFGLWSAAGSFAMRELTDGWVPDYWVQTWPGAKAATRRLLDVGLWVEETQRGVAGYRFHDWLTIQRSAASVHEEREKGRERARRNRQRSAARTGGRSPELRADVREESRDSRALPGPFPEGVTSGGTSGTERARPSNTPRPRCPRHADWPADQQIPPCLACKQLRLAAEQHAADLEEQAADERAARRDLIDNCTRCDEHGYVAIGDYDAVRCTHPDQP